MELKAKISAVMAGAKEQGKAEEETIEGGGPTVTDQDIANIVAQWTGIPIEKVRSAHTWKCEDAPQTPSPSNQIVYCLFLTHVDRELSPSRLGVF